ncbi:hypothetical protein B0H16DRAFT_1631167 [Mycena metata]|uniref:F-box domain-containing protein n=1 Tax=Mycena metata TaxID=1033252 RepID=A0AAD7H129_9AGAR|nr:hypothetical protein B0H16DRAFT_1631167 [Mycena metata]
MAGVQCLSEYLFLLVCLELELPDVLSLRRVCRSFNRATRAKLLWINLLELAVARDGHVLPLYLKPRDLLDGRALEALIVRVTQLARKWQKQDLCPVDVWRMDVHRSITWRLVAGNWLFVASSDHEVSKISCWDLSLVFQGYTEPIAEAYLPGQVGTAQLEVQDTGIVLALGLSNPSSASVHIITLQQHLGSHCFAELSHIEGSSDVLMLQGKYIACAVRDDAVVPHVIDWVAKTTYALPPPPVGGFDTPERRCTPHLFVIWNDFVVIVRHKILDIYTRPSESCKPLYIKSLPTIPISEVVVLNPLALSREFPLRLLVISAQTVQLITVDLDLQPNDSIAPCSHTVLAETPSTSSRSPWYHLRTSGSGTRALWLGVGSMVNPRTIDAPHIISMAVPPQPSEYLAPLIIWTNDVPPDAGIWAFPTLDFDEALGYTVVGNCFGELAIYSHVPSDPLACCGLAPDFTHRQSSPGRMLSFEPIPLRMRPSPDYDLAEVDPETASEFVAHWGNEHLRLDPHIWQTDWCPEAYYDWYHWLGLIGDNAWLLRHAYHFPGPVTPQAHGRYHGMGDKHIVLRVGQQHLLYSDTEELSDKLQSLPLGPLNLGTAERQPCIQSTAYTVARVFFWTYFTRISKRRNP